MKLLLTSAGITNKTIAKALTSLVKKSFDNLNLTFIPTAANVEEGGKEWFIDDLVNLKNLNFKQIDIVDISALSKKQWGPRIKDADILVFSGGNTFHLMNWMQKSGLTKMLPELLKTSVYVGISAGSCITGKTIYNSVQNLFGEKYDLEIKEGLGLVDFQFIPHLNSPYFDKIRVENLQIASKDIDDTVYAMDDNSAVVVDDKKITVVSEGQWEVFNKK